jgi:excisionase family DNA binding protein
MATKNNPRLNKPQVEPRLYDLDAAAEYLCTTVWFLRQQIWNRRIPFLKLGKKYVFDKTDLDVFVDGQKVAARL